MAKVPVPLMGRIAIHLKMISMEQLTEAVRVRGRPGEERRLGDILLDLGFVDQAQLDKLIVAQRQVMAKQREKAEGAAAPAPKPPPAVAREAAKPPPTEEPSSLFTTPDNPLDVVLQQAVSQGASDLHLRSGQTTRMRVAGRLVEGPTPPCDDVASMLLGALDPDTRSQFESDGEIDFCHTVEGLGRFRANLYREQRGIDGVFRHIPAEAPSLDELGLPHDVAKLTNYHQGLVLVTGPTGCGKTSTLASLVDLINEERSDHVLTIEDPIEYLHTSKRCLVNQRSVKRHTGSFARALRAALREDPDVIVIGELRDLETISLALTAAETGHLVIATMHTEDSLRTINRVVGAYPADQQEQVRTMLSESLRAVLSQRLLNRADGHGRVAAVETLIITKAVGNLIRENKVFQIQSILQTGQRQGMQSLDKSIDALLESGAITREEADRHRSASARQAA
ncbi:MAG: type IV pilus twitching motility protein PilT [Myxococcota bacterium]